MFDRRIQALRYSIVTFIVTSFGLGVLQPVSAADITLSLLNHPDANQNPPPYGLRLDNLFNQTPTAGSVTNPVGGVTSFSFDPGDGANMVLTTTTVGTNIEINISGTAFGGVDIGVVYGFGAGFYDIDFTYTANVTEVAGPDGGFTVSPNSVLNNGTITAQAGITDVAAGTSWTLYDQSNNSFLLLADGHRLSSFPALLAQDPLVGRGWVTYNSDGTDASGTQDWLFVPEPSGLALISIYSVGIFARRPRRRHV